MTLVWWEERKAVLCTFDLEFIKNKTKIGLFDPKRIPTEIQNKLLYRLDQIAQIMKLCA